MRLREYANTYSEVVEESGERQSPLSTSNAITVDCQDAKVIIKYHMRLLLICVRAVRANLDLVAQPITF